MAVAGNTSRHPTTAQVEPPSDSKHGWLIAAALTGLILLCYWQVWNFAFVNYDDTDYVSNNPWVQKGISYESIAWAFQTDHASNWHPLTWLSHMLDWQIYGGNPGGHHFTNVLWHVGNTLLLFLLLRKMTGATWRSAFVAALFAIHPLHVESVAWVSERKDVVSTFFGFLSLWFYTNYAQARNARASVEEKAIANRQSPKINGWALQYAAALLFFALSLMSKPMFVTMPFLLLLLDVWPLRRSSLEGASRSQLTHRKLNTEYWPRLFIEKLPFLLLTIVSCYVTIAVQAGKTMQTLTDFGVLARISNALVSYVTYLIKTFWPSDLAFFYPLLGAPSAGKVIAASCVLLLVSVLAVLTWKKAPYVLIGWLWYLGTLVPVIGFVHVGEQALADRYTYIPLIGIFLALVWLVTDRASYPKNSTTSCQALLPSAAIVVVLGFAFLTYIQVKHWRNSETLMKRALAVTKNNFIALNNYGVVLSESGKHDEAAAYYRRATVIKPHYARAYSNLGAALSLTGKFHEAIEVFEKALSLRASDAETHYNLAVTLAQLEDYAGTIKHCREALILNPNYTVAHFDLGLALSLMGENQQAVDHFKKYLETFPTDKTAQELLAASLQKVTPER